MNINPLSFNTNTQSCFLKVIESFVLIYLPYNFKMSQSGDQEGAAFKKYLDNSRVLLKRIREFDYHKFFQDIITFLSIVRTYPPTQSHISSSHSHTNFTALSKS